MEFWKRSYDWLGEVGPREKELVNILNTRPEEIAFHQVTKLLVIEEFVAAKSRKVSDVTLPESSSKSTQPLNQSRNRPIL